VADDVEFKFEFIDKTGLAPVSSKPGTSSGGGASSGVGESFQETAGDAPDKAQQRNERKTGGAGKSRPASVPGSGASSPTAVAGSGSRGSANEIASSLGAVGSSAKDFAREAASGNILGAARAGRNVVDAVSEAAGKLGTPPASGVGMSGSTAGTATTTAARVAGGRAAFGVGASAVPESGAATTTAARVAGGRAAFGVGASAVTESGAAAGAGAGAAGAMAVPVGLALASVAIPAMIGNKYADSVKDRYAELSPDVAAAAAQAEVRQILGDLRRSQRNGARVAENIEERSKLSEDLQDISAILSGPFMDIANDVLSIIGSLVDIVRQGLEFAQPLITAAEKVYEWTSALPVIAMLLEKLRDDEDEAFDLLAWFEAQPHIHPPEWPTPAAGEAQLDPKTIKFGKVPGLIL
jgi:hypothetical protein